MYAIECHYSGDYQYQFMAKGCHGHASSKSLTEMLKHAQWQKKATAGPLLTQEAHRAMVLDYRDVHHLELGNPEPSRAYTEEEFAALKIRVAEAKAVTGITHIFCLVSSIIFLFWHQPGLHIMLGIINGMLQAIHKLVLHRLEPDTDEIVAAKVELLALRAALATLSAEQAAFEQSSSDEQIIKSGMEAADKITTTKQFKTLHSRLAVERSFNPDFQLPPGMMATFAQLRATLEPVVEYATLIPGSAALNASRAGFELRVAVHDAKEMDIEMRVKAAEVAVKAAQAALKAAKLKQQNRPIKRKMVELLDAKFSIRLSQTYTMQLNGASCQRFVAQGDAIGVELLDLFVQTLDEEADRDLIAYIRHFLDRIVDLCRVMDYVCEMLSNFDRQDVTQFNRFDLACNVVGLLWRALQLSVTLKVHALEVLMPREFRRYNGRIGHWNEGSVERMHGDDNIRGRLYNGIAANGPRQDAKDLAREQGKMSGIQNVVDKVKEGSKRTMSADTIARKAAKRATVGETRAQRMVELDFLLNRVSEELRDAVQMPVVPQLGFESESDDDID